MKRTITAEQYRIGDHPEDGFDEAFIRHPGTGTRHEVWDVAEFLDETGSVVIYTAAAEPLFVRPEHPIEIR